MSQLTKSRRPQWHEGPNIRHEHGRDHINTWLLKEYLDERDEIIERQAKDIKELQINLQTISIWVGRLELALEKKLDRPREWFEPEEDIQA